MGRQPRFAGHAFKEGQTVVFGLEAQQIIIAEIFKQLVPWRQRVENFRRRERDMQEETDAVVDAAFAQLAGKRQQVVIVDPYDIVLLH